MDRSDFEHDVLSGGKNDSVSPSVLAFFGNNADFQVIDRSAMEKDAISQTEFFSVTLPESGSNYSDNELISQVKKALTGTSRDIQKYQMRDGGKAPNTIEIWRHGSGFSAFALYE